MAAGLGFKTFTTGEVLTAADTNGYLMQGVLVFATATARDAAITSPQEGQFAYLKDTNVTTYYTGSAWANLDTTGMTNPMTTTGDIIYSSSGSTPARLGIGTAGQVLKVNSGATAPEWGTAGGGGKLLQLVSATTNTGVTNTTDTYADTGLTATITPTLATSKILVIISQAIECDVSSGNTGTEINATINLLRGATSIWQANRALMTSDGTTTTHFVGAHISITCYDSPATTSATTYKTQFRRYNGATRAIAQWADEMRSTITLMEIGA